MIYEIIQVPPAEHPNQMTIGKLRIYIKIHKRLGDLV